MCSTVGEDRLSLEVKTHGSAGFGSSAVAAIGTRQRRRVVAIVDLGASLATSLLRHSELAAEIGSGAVIV